MFKNRKEKSGKDGREIRMGQEKGVVEESCSLLAGQKQREGERGERGRHGAPGPTTFHRIPCSTASATSHGSTEHQWTNPMVIRVLNSNLFTKAPPLKTAALRTNPSIHDCLGDISDANYDTPFPQSSRFNCKASKRKRGREEGRERSKERKDETS